MRLALYFTTVASLALAATSILLVIALVVARGLRSHRNQRSQAQRLALTRAMLIAQDNPQADQVWTAMAATCHPDNVADTAIEMLAVLRGEDGINCAALFAQIGTAETLRQRLIDKDPRRRLSAAEALAWFPYLDTESALTDALADKSSDVQLAAALSLVRLGKGPDIKQIVADIFGGELRHSPRSSALFEQLFRIQPDFVAATASDQSQSTEMRTSAILALKQAEHQDLVSVAALSRSAITPVAEASLATLGKIHHPLSADAVRTALYDRRPVIRRAAARAAA